MGDMRFHLVFMEMTRKYHRVLDMLLCLLMERREM